MAVTKTETQAPDDFTGEGQRLPAKSTAMDIPPPKSRFMLGGFVLAGAVLLAGFAAFYLLLPHFISARDIEASIVRQIEEEIEGAFQFEKVKVTSFPQWSVRFQGIHLKALNENLDLIAPRLDVHLSFLELLFGRLSIGSVRLTGGTLRFKSLVEGIIQDLQLTQLNFVLKTGDGIKGHQANFSAGIGEAAQAVEGHFVIQSDRILGKDWKSLGLQAEVILKPLTLTQLKTGMRLQIPFELESGKMEGQASIRKEKDDSWSVVHSDVKLAEFVYAFMLGQEKRNSAPIRTQIKSVVLWNPLTEEVKIDSGHFIFPNGSIDLNGQVALGTGEIQEMRLSATDLALEEIPLYWVPLREKIPVSLGFSGPSQWDVSLQGTPDHLTFHANVDLTDANITYAGYFSKPKNTLMAVTTDSLIKKGGILVTDFSVRCQEALLKGTLTDFNLATGEGQINLITNKFQIQNFQNLVLPLQNYDIRGVIKILTNGKGNLYQWRDAEKVLNVTFEKGQLLRSGAQIEDIKLVLDYSGKAFSVKDASFRVGDSSVAFDLAIFNLPEHPHVEWTLQSERLEPFRVLDTVQDLTLEWLPAPSASAFENAKAWSRQFFPESGGAQNLKASVRLKDDLWVLENLEFNAYGGSLKASGSFIGDTSGLRFDGELEMNRWDLGPYLRSETRDIPVAEGSLFLKMKIQAPLTSGTAGPAALQGEGTFLVTQGRLNSLDLSKALSGLTELQSVVAAGDGTTAFDDVRASFTMADNKIITERLLFISPDLHVMSHGETTLEGLLNHRLDIYLSPEKSRRLLEPVLSSGMGDEARYFGPIPVLLTGSFWNPEVQADPKRLPEILNVLKEKKEKQILDRYLPAEPFLEETNS